MCSDTNIRHLSASTAPAIFYYYYPFSSLKLFNNLWGYSEMIQQRHILVRTMSRIAWRSFHLLSTVYILSPVHLFFICFFFLLSSKFSFTVELSFSSLINLFIIAWQSSKSLIGIGMYLPWLLRFPCKL